MKVTVQQALSKSYPWLPSTQDFSYWACAIGPAYQELGVRLVDDKEAEKLNCKYRKKSYVPNVLAFPFTSPLAETDHYLGDIVLAVDQVFREAQVAVIEAPHHWAHLFVHGVLHLQGYDHQSDTEERIMQEQEQAILKKLGLPSPYAQLEFGVS